MGCAPSKEEPGQIALKDVQADVAINSGRRMTETKRRIAVRAETTDLEEAFTPPTYPKSEDAKDRIRQGVVQNAQGDGLLKELTAQQKEDMINAMIEVTCKAGDLCLWDSPFKHEGTCQQRQTLLDFYFPRSVLASFCKAHPCQLVELGGRQHLLGY